MTTPRGVPTRGSKPDEYGLVPNGGVPRRGGRRPAYALVRERATAPVSPNRHGVLVRLTTPSEHGRSVIALLVAVAVTLGLAAGFTIAIESFHVGKYNCGSVISPNDPRAGTTTNDLAPLSLAHNQCESRRSDKQRSAAALVIASAGFAIFSLTVPPLFRRERRAMRRRRRARY